MKKRILLIVLTLIILSGAVVFYILSLPPKDKLTEEFKKKALTDLLGRQVNLTDDTPKGDTEFDGKYISFKYPAKAVIYTFRENSTSSSSGALEDFSFDIKEPKLVFNLRVSSNNTNISDVSDFPAVRLRESRLYEYKKSDFLIGKSRGVAYAKDGQEGEKSGFILNGNEIYSFSVTGSNTDAVSDLFDSVVSSSKFK